jgi:hypothetical protein
MLGIGVAVAAGVAGALIAVVRGPRQAALTPIDPAVVAAIGAVVSSQYPGARITRIEAES